MLDCLPESIEPVGLADVGRSFRGEIAVSAFQRMRPLLADSDGVLKVSLEFRLDERRIRVLKGTVDGEIRLVCQRCLQALTFPLQLEFRLGIVTQEAEIDLLPEGYEPLLVSGEPLNTVEVVEDEVLLVIPTVPMHAGEVPCELGYRNQPLPEKDNPFSILEKLKT
jgi:uncharacterized protein